MFPVTIAKALKDSINFQVILQQCFITDTDITAIQSQLDEYTNFIDVVYYFWLKCPDLLETIDKTNEKVVSRVLHILQQVPIPSEDELIDFDEELLLCFTKSIRLTYLFLDILYGINVELILLRRL